METLKKLFGADPRVQSVQNSTFGQLFEVVASGQRWMAKRLHPHLFPSERFGEAADRVNFLTRFSYLQLQAVGVPVPDRYETHVVDGSVWHLISHHGRDAGKILDDQPDLIGAKIGEVLEAVRGLVTAHDPAVGLDPRLSNFAGNGRAVYVDIFPPLCRVDGRTYVHFPNPREPERIAVEVGRKFTAAGIMRRLRFEFLAVDPSSAPLFEAAVARLLPSPTRELVLASFKDLPDNEIPNASAERLRQIVVGFRGSEIEEMRSFAARMLPKESNRKRLMQEVFILTSSYPTWSYPESQNERLELFRAMLLGHIYRQVRK